MKYFFYYRKNGLQIGIVEEDNAIIGVLLGRQKIQNAQQKERPLIKKTGKQIEEYLEGRRRQFSVPLSLHGTDFQKAVWKALIAIPYGETRAYCEIAESIGKPKAARAVGMANHNNPISIIVPCHRVIGKNGSITGYASGLKNKEKLLKLEFKRC